MALRSSWKGFLKLSLVSVPVKSFSAVSAHEGEIHFHQLHDKCHSRIKYVKTCPKHGAVPADEIVSGYEYAKGEYIVISEQELEELRGDQERSVTIETIIPITEIDPVFLTSRISYLVPDGKIGQKPYALIEKCLNVEDVVALARLTLNGKDDLVMIKPLQGLLMMTVLNPSLQVMAVDSFTSELADVAVSSAEVKMTKTLIDAFRHDTADLSSYKDRYTEQLTELIEAKAKGKEIVQPPSTEEPDVINLMEALKKSVAFAKSNSNKTTTQAAEKKSTKSAPRHAASPGRKSKTA